MPSSKNYVRDIKQEYKTAEARGEKNAGPSGVDAKRHRARAEATKLGMVKPKDGKDLDHKTPLSKGGGNSPSNFRVETPHQNRSFPRNPVWSMIQNKEKTPPPKKP